jgi:hypothetical protein
MKCRVERKEIASRGHGNCANFTASCVYGIVPDCSRCCGYSRKPAPQLGPSVRRPLNLQLQPRRKARQP